MVFFLRLLYADLRMVRTGFGRPLWGTIDISGLDSGLLRGVTSCQLLDNLLTIGPFVSAPLYALRCLRLCCVCVRVFFRRAGFLRVVVWTCAWVEHSRTRTRRARAGIIKTRTSNAK
jgi:hypothetical protein